MDREQAARLYDRVLEHGRRGDHAGALALLDTILVSYPAMAVLHVQRGTLLQGMKQFDDALASFDTALALDPLQSEAQFGRGAIFQAQGKLDDALSAYDRVLQIQPAHTHALNNRALALRQTGNLAGALESYDAAIALMPDCPDFRFGKAMCLLQLGRLEEGWRLYEWRKAKIQLVAPPPPGVRPWRGEALAGKTLLIQAEQGLGDTIQFCRFAALAPGEGAHVVLQVQDRLTRLLATLPFPATVIGAQSPPPPCDYHVTLMSLPFHRPGSIPNAIPYLAAEPQRVQAWRTRIGAAGFKIGISWQGERTSGGEEKDLDIGRSFPLRQFEAIAATQGVRLVSLQKNEGVEQLNHLAGGMRIQTLGDDFDAGEHAFLDTAAAMQSLDLVITADTAVAHLAGALGRPVWLALKHAPDWRWLLAREDTPWYPTMRLFRQTVPDDWRGPFDRMAAALRDRGT
jgi:tetratricopeptide (TPR) repeat protein